ncbi:Hypothetical_protein [Hexamita inflata]|uniref:Hypothetical_protein n=1 Tax=Hexamita inflata TaxID=28002 RepID=A0AA86QGV1_9EUKA|nr:Hypothetical protein HINF_LOCUS45643 [Hexamita inflata]
MTLSQFSQLQYKQLNQNNLLHSASSQICSSSKLGGKQWIQYCLKAVTLASQVQSQNIQISPHQEVFHSLYTERTQSLRIDLVYSITSLPSFALFGLTNNIQVLNSSLTVKIPEPILTGSLICFNCNMNTSFSEFSFVAQTYNGSGLVYSPSRHLTIFYSLVQFRLNGRNIGGLVFSGVQLPISFFTSNISGYCMDHNIAGSVIAFLHDFGGIYILVENSRIYVNVKNYIGYGEIALSGMFTESCDLCNDLYYTYGLCLNIQEHTYLNENQQICKQTIIFDGNQCQCSAGLQISTDECVVSFGITLLHSNR